MCSSDVNVHRGHFQRQTSWATSTHIRKFLKTESLSSLRCYHRTYAKIQIQTFLFMPFIMRLSFGQLHHTNIWEQIEWTWKRFLVCTDTCKMSLEHAQGAKRLECIGLYSDSTCTSCSLLLKSCCSFWMVAFFSVWTRVKSLEASCRYRIQQKC